MKVLDIIAHYEATYGKSQFGCQWVKVLRPGTDGVWGPKCHPAFMFRSGTCIGFLPNRWIKACLQDPSCQAFPWVDSKEGKKVYADDLTSEKGKEFRQFYNMEEINPLQRIEELKAELQKLEEERTKLEIEETKAEVPVEPAVLQPTIEEIPLPIVEQPKKRGRKKKV